MNTFSADSTLTATLDRSSLHFLSRLSRKWQGMGALALLFAGTAWGQPANAATNTFSAGTTWNSTSDWSLGTTPSSTDALFFNSTTTGTTTTLDGSYTAQTLSFNTGNKSVNINGNATGTTAQSLTLSGGTNALGTTDVIDLGTSSGTINIGANASTSGIVGVNFSNGGNVNLGTAGGSLVIGTSNVATGTILAGTGTISVSGTTGSLQIIGGSSTSGANSTFTGAFQVNSGTLGLSLGTESASNTIYIASTGTFNPFASNASSTIGGLNDVVAGSGGNVIGAHSRILTLGGGGTYSFSGVIGQASATVLSLQVSLTGSGSQTLSGTNTFTGGTTLSSGTLVVANASGLGSGNLSINGASTLDLASDGAGGTGTGTVTFGNNVAISATSATIGVNDVTSSVTNKTLALGTMAFNNNITLNITGGSGYTLGLGASTIGSTSGSTITLVPTSASVAIASVTGAAASTKINNLLLQGSSSGNTIGAIADGSGGGTVSVQKSSSSTWTLKGTNSYTGATSISAGTLIVSGSTATGSAVTMTGGTLLVTGTVGGTVALGSTATLSGTGSTGVVTVAGGAFINTVDGSVGKLTVGGLTAITSTTSNFTFEIGSSGTADSIATTALNVAHTIDITIDNLNNAGTQGIQNGTYNLISYTTLSAGALSNFALQDTSLDGHTLALTALSGGDLVLTVSGGTPTATSTTYTLGTVAASNLLHKGGTTTVTTTITNTGTSANSADTLSYSGLGATPSAGTVTAASGSGGPVANNNGTATFGQTYTGTTVGTNTLTAAVTSATNTTLGTNASLSGTAGTAMVNVYSGTSTWATNGNGSWGTLTGTGSEAFGANWGANQGSPGLDPSFKGVDTATFGAQAVSTATVSLNGAAPNVNSITFSSPSTSYTLAPGTGGNSITLSQGAGASLPSINVTGTATAGMQTISAPVILGSNTSVNVGSKQTLDITGAISGVGTGLTYTGPGTTITTADNSYSGGTVIAGGVLLVNNTGGLTSYSAPATSANRTITPVNSTGSGTGTGGVTVQMGATLAGSGTIAPTSGGIELKSGATLASGGIQSGTSAGQGLTVNNAAGLSNALLIDGGATLSFALGSTTSASGGSGALNYANPNTNSTYLSLTGGATDLIFADTTTKDNINLIDLTNGSGSVALTLRTQNPYLLIQTDLGNNADFANLMTTGGLGKNGLVLGVSDGGTGFTAFNLMAYDINGNPISSSTNLQNLQLYLYNGDLEVVPEPGTWALMLGGLTALIFWQRRKGEKS